MDATQPQPTTNIPADAASLTAREYHGAFPSADSEAIEAHLNIMKAGALLTQAVSRHLAGYDGGMTGARYSALRALYFAPGHRLPHNEIARHMGTTAGNTTQLIDGLEKAELVERVASPTSRRVVLVQLTERGQAVCADLVPSMVQLMEETCAMFTPEEKRELGRLLSKFRDHLSH